MPGYNRFWLDDGQGGAPVTPKAGQTDPQQAVPRAQFRAFPCGPLKYADWWRRAKFSSPRAARERKIEDRVARSVAREMGIGENYERNITPIRSDISRFSGGTNVGARPGRKCTSPIIRLRSGGGSLMRGALFTLANSSLRLTEILCLAYEERSKCLFISS